MLLLLVFLQGLHATNTTCTGDTSLLPFLDECICNDSSKQLVGNTCTTRQRIILQEPQTLKKNFDLNRSFTYQGWFKAEVGSILYSDGDTLTISVQNGLLNVKVIRIALAQLGLDGINDFNINQEYDITQWFFFRFTFTLGTGYTIFFNEEEIGDRNFLAFEASNNDSFSIYPKAVKDLALFSHSYSNTIDDGVTRFYFNLFQDYNNVHLFYPFDEPVGSTSVQDYSPNAFSQTLTENQSFQEDDLLQTSDSANYYLLNYEKQGLSQSVQSGVRQYPLTNDPNKSSPVILFNENFTFPETKGTIHFYFKMLEDPLDATCFFFDIQFFMALQISLGDFIHTSFQNSLESVTISQNTVVQDEWYSMAMSCDGNNCDVFLDGVFLQTSAFTMSPFASQSGSYTDIFLFRSSNGGNDTCNMAISQFKIYNTNLTNGEIGNLQSKRISPADASNLLIFLPLYGDDVHSDIVNLKSGYRIFADSTTEPWFVPESSNILVFCKKIGRFNIDKYNCGNCVSNCKFCSNDSVCDTCMDNYTLDSNNLCACASPVLDEIKFIEDYTHLQLTFQSPISINSISHSDIIGSTVPTPNVLKLQLKDRFIIRSGDTFSLGPNSITNTVCTITEAIQGTVVQDDNSLPPVPSLTFVQGDIVTFDASQSTSGYSVQPDISDFSFSVLDDQNNEIASQTGSANTLDVDRNLFSPGVVYTASVTITNFIGETASTSISYSYDCSMVSINIVTAAFFNDYLQIKFTQDKLFTLESGSFDNSEYENPQIGSNFELLVDLKQAFTLRDNDSIEVPANSFIVQKCTITTPISVTLQGDTKKPPIAAIQYTETDETITLLTVGSSSEYPLQPQMVYHFEIWTFITNEILVDIPNETTGTVTIQKSELTLNENYILRVSISNFLNESTTTTQNYAYRCLLPTIDSAAYSSDYVKVVLTFSKNVSIAIQSFLQTNQGEVESQTFNTNVIELTLKENYNLFLSDTILANTLQTDFCFIDQNMPVTISEPPANTYINPQARLIINDISETELQLSATNSVSGYAVQPLLTANLEVKKDNTVIASIVQSSTMPFSVDKSLLTYNEVYDMFVEVEDFKMVKDQTNQSYFYECQAIVEEAHFTESFTKIYFKFDRDISKIQNSQITFDFVSEVVFGQQSLTFTLEPNFTYKELEDFLILGGFFETNLCQITQNQNIRILPKDPKTPPVLSYTTDVLDSGNSKLRFDASASDSSYPLQLGLEYSYRLFKDDVLQNVTFTNNPVQEIDLETLNLGFGQYKFEISVKNYFEEVTTQTYIHNYFCKLEITATMDGFVVNNGEYSRKQAIDMVINHTADPSNHNFNLIYDWSLVTSTSNNFVYPLTNESKSLLSLPSYSIEGDKDYTIAGKLQLTDSNNAVQCEIWHKFSFTTEREPIFCKIKGGDISVPKEQPIRVDASNSMDPNFFYQDQLWQDSVYKWEINNVEEVGQTTNILDLAAERFQSDTTNIIVMTQTSPNGQTCQDQQTIVVRENYEPTGQIVPLLSKNQQTFVSNLPVLFKAEIKTKYPLSVEYAWELVGKPEVNSTEKYFKIDPAQHLVVGDNFQIQLKVKDLFGENTQIQTYELIGPPSAGTFVASQTQGTALQDFFKLEALGYTDANPPLRYDFYQDGTLLKADSTSNELITQLNGQGIVKVFCKVKNSKDGEITSNMVDINLSPNPTQDTQQEMLAAFGQIDNSEATFEESLPKILQLSQSIVEDDDLSFKETVMDRVLTLYDPAQVTPQNVQQFTEIIKNVRRVQPVQNVTEAQNLKTYQVLKTSLENSLQQSAVYLDELNINSQIERPVQVQAVENIRSVLEMELDLNKPEIKDVMDLIGLSNLIFNVPSDPIQTLSGTNITISSQRIDTINYRDLNIDNRIVFPPQGVGYVPPAVYDQFMPIPDNHQDYVYIVYENPNDTNYQSQMSLTLYDSTTLQRQPYSGLAQNITFTHVIDQALNANEVTCMSREAADEAWAEGCVVQDVERLQSGKTQVICSCNHLTDFSVLVTILAQSNILDLWSNFFNNNWSNVKEMFSWVFAEQLTFIVLFVILYFVAKRIDNNFRRTERYHTERYIFEQLHHKFNHINQGFIGKEHLHQKSVLYQKKHMTWQEVLKIMYSKFAISQSLKQEFSYISWIFFPQKNYQSRVKYVLLMIRVQSLFFLIFLQIISEVEGTWRGYVYSLITVIFFQLLVTMFFKHTMLYRPNQVQERYQEKRKQTYNEEVVQERHRTMKKKQKSNQMIQEENFTLKKSKMQPFKSQWYMRPFQIFSMVKNPRVEENMEEEEEHIQDNSQQVKPFVKFNDQQQKAQDPNHAKTVGNDNRVPHKLRQNSMNYIQKFEELESNELEEDRLDHEYSKKKQDKEQKSRLITKKHFKLHEHEQVINLDESQISLEENTLEKDHLSVNPEELNSHDLEDQRPKENTQREKQFQNYSQRKSLQQENIMNSAQQRKQQIQHVENKNLAFSDLDENSLDANNISISIKSEQKNDDLCEQDFYNFEIEGQKEMHKKQLNSVRYTTTGQKVSSYERFSHRVQKKLIDTKHAMKSKEGQALMIFLVYFVVTFVFLFFFAKTASVDTQWRWLLFSLGNVAFDMMLEIFIILFVLRLLTLLNFFYKNNSCWKSIMQVCGATHFLLQVIVDKYD